MCLMELRKEQRESMPEHKRTRRAFHDMLEAGTLLLEKGDFEDKPLGDALHLIGERFTLLMRATSLGLKHVPEDHPDRAAIIAIWDLVSDD